MSEAIEEIGRKQGERRNEAMEAWAAMIYSDQNRRSDLGVVQETAGCGGSSVPKETFVPTDAKKVAKLKEIKQAQEALRAEAARTQDKVESAEPARLEARPMPVPPTAIAQPARQVEQARQAERQDVREQAEVAREEAVESARQARPEIEMPATLGNSVEAATVHATAMSLSDTKSPDQVDKAREAEPPIEVESAEQAALLAALKSGAGANPDLIAKAYVQAAGMEGVKGTLQEGMLQGFVVAL